MGELFIPAQEGLENGELELFVLPEVGFVFLDFLEELSLVLNELFNYFLRINWSYKIRNTYYLYHLIPQRWAP